MNKPTDTRGYLISTEIVKRGWFKPRAVIVKVTDGRDDINFVNTGSLTIETDKPLVEQAIKADWWNEKHMNKPITDTSNDGYYELKARPQFLNILTLKGKPIDPNRTILEQQNDPESVLYSANIRPDLPTEKGS